jgi:hypothetical protein
MTQVMVLDPTATRADDVASPGPDAGVLAGKRIAVRVDNIWRAWDIIAEQWAAKFRAAGARVTFWRGEGRSGDEGERMNREWAELCKTADIAVVGLANCGSCTGWTVRDAIAAANAGLATTAVGTKNFEDFAHELAKRGGRSGLRLHVLPYPLNELADEDVKAIGESYFDGLLKVMGAQLAVREAPAAREAAE